MSKIIDCLFIGHNETDLHEYEKTVKRMGTLSGAYRDLNLNFIWYDGKPYSASEMYNLVSPCGSYQPLSTGDTFSAAIAYLGTYLYRRNFSFDYVNSFQDQQQELKEKLLQENILTIAIVTTLYVSVFPILEIMEFIKKYNHTARIIIGGPFISTQFRSQGADFLAYLLETTIGADIYVNSSQGEATLVKILHALKNNLTLDGINNIYYKKDGKYISTPLLKEQNKLSENMVHWPLFADKVRGSVNIRTAISCPFSCAFCGFPEHAGKHQYVDTENIYAELRMLEKIQSVQCLNFIDDTFNVPVKRFKEILRMMIREKFKFPWVSNFRCQFADREMVELMKKSGCNGVFLGIESANNQVLANMKKAATVEKFRDGIALLKEYDIVTMGSFIIGFPGETPETVKDTMQFIQETQLDFFRAQLWYCEPITPIWQEREKYELRGESFEWQHNTMDSQTACDLLDELFLKIDKSLWVPQYNFDFDKIWQLKLRGMDIRQIKEFLRAFYRGIKEKLKKSYRHEVDFEVIQQMKLSLNGKNDDLLDEVEEINTIDREQVTFNF